MPPIVATILCFMGIFWLFFLDREGSEKTSKALWIPVIWLLIGGSRNVGQWIQMSSPMDRSERYLDGNPIDRAVLGLLMLLGFIVLFKRHRQVLTILRSSGPVLLFFFYCMVSCVWSEYPDVALKRWVRGLGDLVMVLVILTEPYLDTRTEAGYDSSRYSPLSRCRFCSSGTIPIWVEDITTPVPRCSGRALRPTRTASE